MVALHRWNPEVNHEVLIFFCPFRFQMVMRDSQLHCHHFGKNFDHLLMIHCYLLPLPFFFLVFGTYPYKNYSSAIPKLTPAVLFILLAGLSPRGMRSFFGSFLLINPWIIRGVHSINDILRDLTAKCSNMLPWGICKFLKTVPYLSDKWILNWWFSGLTYFPRFIVMTISAGHDQYLKS